MVQEMSGTDIPTLREKRQAEHEQMTLYNLDDEFEKGLLHKITDPSYRYKILYGEKIAKEMEVRCACHCSYCVMYVRHVLVVFYIIFSRDRVKKKQGAN
jgi:hypothetical protein